MSLNPYWGNTFFEFFVTLAMRLLHFFDPESPPMALASDELQLIVLLLISVSTALIGTFLVLRRMTMLANALSHTILPGVVVAYLLYHYVSSPQEGLDFTHLLPSDALLIAAGLIAACLTTFLTEMLIQHLRVSVDASIGMVFTLLFAVGIILVTAFTKSSHVGAELLMGNVDALHYDDMQLIFWIFLANCTLVAIFWRPLFVSSFDPLFAKMCGLSNVLLSYLIMALVAVTAIGAFRAVGVLLYLAFLVTPVLIARLYTNSLKMLALLSCSLAALSSLLSVALSRHLVSVYMLPTSTAALVVVVLSLIFALSRLSLKLRFTTKVRT